MLPKKWKTSRKLALAFGLLILIITFTAFIIIQQIQRIDRDVARVIDVETPLEQSILEMKINLGETASAVFNYTNNRDSTNKERIMDYKVNFNGTAAEFSTLAWNDEIKQIGQEIGTNYKELNRLGYEIMNSLDQQFIVLEIFRENVRELDYLMNEEFQAAIDITTPEGVEKIEAAIEMESGMDETFSAIEAYISEADPSMQQNSLNAKADFEKFEEMYRQTSLSIYEESLLNTITSDFQKTVDEGNILIEDMNNLNIQIGLFEQGINEITDYIDSQVQPLIHIHTIQAITDAENSTKTATKWLIALSIIGIFISSVSAWMVSRGIIKGFRDVLRGIEKIAGGKLDHRLNVDAKGEFGQLALAFNRMMKDLGRSVDNLKRNEEMVWALLNASSDSAILIDTKGTILALNKSATERFNKKESELVKRCLYDFLPADLMITRKLQVAEVVRTGKPLHFEEKYNGMILDQIMYPVFGLRGKVARLAIFAGDVTIRKWVDEVAEQLGQRNELILKSAGEGIYGVDTQGKTTFVNPAAARMLGYEPDELIGKSHHEIVHHSRLNGALYPSHQCPIYAAFKDGTVHIGDDEVFWRKDGTSFPVAYTSTPMIDDGQILGAVVTYQDITERKRLEEALRESEKKYRSIYESVASMVLSVDEDGCIVDCNPRIHGILGYTPDEVIGQSLMNIIHPDYSPKARETLKNVLTKGFDYNKSYKMVQKNGKPIEVNMNAVVVRNDRGEYVRTICMIGDISEPVQV